MTEPPDAQAHIYTPTELNLEVKHHIEAGFGRIWVQGEISNLSRPSSGHQYFTLKDGRSQIRCALFRPHAEKLNFKPSDGDEVLVRGQLSLYAPRGDYQLIADTLLNAGLGALHAEFERLKKKLAEEGLFDSVHKRPLPKWPKHIAIVTSASGAALRDIRQTLAKRWPVARTSLFPSLVQGETAPRDLIQALLAADQAEGVDTIILARGGGSVEDLWAFNDEILARTIFQLQTPIVTGIGHETDTTISDFVSDQRAPTPTAAAVFATPDQQEVEASLMGFKTHILRAITRQLEQASQGVDLMEHRLSRSHPLRLLERATDQLSALKRRLALGTNHRLIGAESALNTLARTLNGLSPLKVLERGYAVVTDTHGQALQAAQTPEKSSLINILTNHFEIEAQVISVANRRKPSSQ